MRFIAHPRGALNPAIAKRRRAIKDIMTAQGIPDFQAPSPIPKFIDTSHAIDDLPECPSPSKK